jgi:hypothetical protein
VRAEPEEIRAVVARVLAQREQETGDVAIDLGDAEIAGFVVQPAQTGDIQRQDRGTSGIVECEHRVQIVRLHVADA